MPKPLKYAPVIALPSTLPITVTGYNIRFAFPILLPDQISPSDELKGVYADETPIGMDLGSMLIPWSSIAYRIKCATLQTTPKTR